MTETPESVVPNTPDTPYESGQLPMFDLQHAKELGRDFLLGAVERQLEEGDLEGNRNSLQAQQVYPSLPPFQNRAFQKDLRNVVKNRPGYVPRFHHADHLPRTGLNCNWIATAIDTVDTCIIIRFKC